MIKAALEKLFNEFPSYDVKEAFPFEGSELAEYIRHNVPAAFRVDFPQFPTIEWEASPGKGQWADAPWIAAFNPLVTHTAQDGYYPVILFTSSLDSFYLSLNQGMTKLRKEFSDREALNVLRHRAEILRTRLNPSFSEAGFSNNPIDLHPRGAGTRLAYYEPGHAFGKMYHKDQLPTEAELKSDIANMLKLYAMAFSRGGTTELDQDETAQDPNNQDDLGIEERLRYIQHRSIERNRKLSNQAKKIHGYICQVCGFNFYEKYGELGKEFIEAHHKVPLSMLPKDEFIKLSAKDDFAVLCSNCHSIIHRPGAPSTFEEFLSLYRNVSRT